MMIDVGQWIADPQTSRYYSPYLSSGLKGRLGECIGDQVAGRRINRKFNKSEMGKKER